jgi:hypothetical protein
MVPVSPYAAVNAKGSSVNRRLILLDGRRVPGPDSGVVDLNAIPITQIDRIEVLKDRSSSIYGTDAVSGVVNLISQKPASEFDCANISVGYQYDLKCSIKLNYTMADKPPEPPAPQPMRASSQFLMFQLSPEMMMMAAYGSMIQRSPSGLPMNSEARDVLQAAILCSGTPFMLPPLGAAFVNGKFVKAKQADLIYGMFLKRNYMESLKAAGVTPFHIYSDFMRSLEMGGSGGAYADAIGYQALGVPPLF